MPVNILFIGDVVGAPGRDAIRELVPVLRRELRADVIVANGENSAGGAGITMGTAAELFSAGVDVITTGDHVWDQKEALQLVENEPRLLRPANYPPRAPGHGSFILEMAGHPAVGVINGQGRVFMQPLENPFSVLDEEVNKVRRSTNVILVDFHAEATSEKIAMARMLDGRVSAVIGTHTHVQTADEQIFPGGTAFLCDAGFTGPHESVIGRDIEPVVRRFRTQLPQRFTVAAGRVLLQGALIEVDPQTGRALRIERVSRELNKGEA